MDVDTRTLPNPSMATVKRLVQIARSMDLDTRTISVTQRGVVVPSALASRFEESVAIIPLALAPNPICGAPDGPGQQVTSVPCELDLTGCGSIDPDVALVFTELFTCLESKGIITDSWKSAFD